jgi:hypothetical protein
MASELAHLIGMPTTHKGGALAAKNQYTGGALAAKNQYPSHSSPRFRL